MPSPLKPTFTASGTMVCFDFLNITSINTQGNRLYQLLNSRQSSSFAEAFNIQRLNSQAFTVSIQPL